MKTLGIILAVALFAALCLLGAGSHAFLNKKMMMAAPAAPIQGGPGGSCLVGNGTPTISVPASHAGFTNCIVAMDWTATTGFATTPASYIQGCGASASAKNNAASWVFYNNIGYGRGNQPCNRSNWVLDGATHALQITWHPSDIPTTPTDDGNSTLTFPTFLNVSPTNTSGWVPAEYFFKLRVRTDTSTLLQGNSPGHLGHIDWWSTEAALQDNAGTRWVDHNYMESGNPANPANINSSYCMTQQIWNPKFSTGCVNPGSVDMTSYHTIAGLSTSNETTDAWICLWIDPDVTYNAGFKTCVDIPGNVFGSRDRFLLLAYSATDFNGNAVFPNDSNFWLTNFEMWTCPNLFSGCPGTMITTWP